MKHQSSQFSFCMLYHKHDFSFLGACHIPKYLTREKPYFRGHMSKIAVTGTERWTSYPSLVHTEPWLLPTALQSCMTASVGPLAGLWNLPLCEEHTDRAFRDSLLPSLQDQDGVMCHILCCAWTYGLKHRGWKDLIQCTFWLMRRVRLSTKRHLHRLNQKQSTNS